MAARRNGPRAGPVLGISWEKLPLKVPKLYPGTSTGAKTNTCRANIRYPEMRFRSFKKNKKVYIERTR